jgi:hypothetical protein
MPTQKEEDFALPNIVAKLLCQFYENRVQSDRIGSINDVGIVFDFETDMVGSMCQDLAGLSVISAICLFTLFKALFFKKWLT